VSDDLFRPPPRAEVPASSWPDQERTAPQPWNAPPAQRPEVRRRPTVLALVAVAAATGLLAGGIGGVTGWALADRESQQRLTDDDAGLDTLPTTGDVDRAPESVAGIAARVIPSVANIEVRAGGEGGTGSGFVIREDGYVLTNNHVVAAGEDGQIALSFQGDEETYEAQIVGRSPEYDLAVLKIDPRDALPVASLGNDDDVVVGDPVVAIGSPLGLAGTVTSGIISAKNRPVTAGGGGEGEVSYISALQTDAAVNPGNSGGPLVDAAGRVIGINSSIATLGGSSPFGEQSVGNIGLGFAIPINQGRRIAEELIETGRAEFPIIGASIDFEYGGEGARIADSSAAEGPALVAGGPAEQAGLQPGDVITSFDGRAVPGPEELIVAIRSRRPGESVEIGYARDGDEGTVTVTLGAAGG
jgi:putative serine protease PepD